MSRRREDAFFGMHFDFHAGINQENIGENCDPKTIDRLLREVKPDYIQCDTKGHMGSTSYPTKAGYPAPNMKGDILRMWRDLTAAHDVALFAHHSGVWDNNAILHNPDWAACDKNNQKSEQKISVFGPYADELLIPQLIEMANDYRLDGVWVDGECWAVIADYSHWAQDAYLRKYNANPPGPSDDDFDTYLNFCRDGFRDYVTHYVNAVHSAAPHFQITSNWMYTSFMPEDPAAPIDFISGDYSPNDSVNSARFEGRCIAGQSKPWDLMAWGFSIGNGLRCVKEYEQLCQEAAAVIMLGGGFQFYNKQLIGTVQEWAIPMWAELAAFCRERETICHKAEFIPQVGVIYSEKAHYNNKKSLFSNSGKYIDELKGTLLSILDAGYSAEILMTHRILHDSNLNDYGILIVSDMNTIEADLRSALLDYVNQGGNLIVSGYDSAQLFLPYLDIDIIGGNDNPTPIYIEHENKMAPVISPYREIKLHSANRSFGKFYLTDDILGNSFTASSITNYGKGRIAGIYYDIGSYMKTKTTVVRRFIKGLLNELFIPRVSFNCAETIEISLMKNNGKICINLLNLEGKHSNSVYKSFDRVPPVYDIDISIKHPV
ncbi:MAG: hypothetical protein PHZ09_12415 [Eubacteriales bacterium]|nr:hypothetical protein [Eubacteriales bacterium]